MKRIFSGFLLLLVVQGLAQKPEQIYGNARQQKPLEYYKQQAAAWKKETEGNPKNPNAWYNYYYTQRNLMFNDTIEKNRTAAYANIKQLMLDMGKNVPESYEYNLCMWMSGGFDLSRLPYLKKAVKMGPERTEHLDYMINMGEIDRILKDRDLYCIKKFDAGLFSTGVIYYNYNVIAGLEPNSILITSGDNDTYPVWLLQAMGIRKDVTVINASLAHLDGYREKIFNELGVNYHFKNNAGNADEYNAFASNLIKQVAENKKAYPVYVALTTACDTKYTDSIQDKLFLTGLAYKYSNTSIDNMAFLKRNMEQNYAFDYLDKSFYKELSPDMVKMINENYIVPMLTLYDHYKISGDEQKLKWLRAKLELVSKGTESEKEVMLHLQP